MLAQSWSWAGSTRPMGWVGSRFWNFWWVWLGHRRGGTSLNPYLL